MSLNGIEPGYDPEFYYDMQYTTTPAWQENY